MHSPAKHPENPVLKATEPWEEPSGLGGGQAFYNEQAGRFEMHYAIHYARRPEVPDEAEHSNPSRSLT